MERQTCSSRERGLSSAAASAGCKKRIEKRKREERKGKMENRERGFLLL